MQERKEVMRRRRENFNRSHPSKTISLKKERRMVQSLAPILVQNWRAKVIQMNEESGD